MLHLTACLLGTMANTRGKVGFIVSNGFLDSELSYERYNTELALVAVIYRNATQMMMMQ
jgi:hypothetical protein